MGSRRKLTQTIGPSQGEIAEDRWPIEVAAIWLHGASLRLCGFWWFIDRRKTESESRVWDTAQTVWVLSWLIVLIIMWAINPPGILKDIFAVFAVLRLIEISSTALGTMLNRLEQSKVQNLITIGIYGLQIALIFAILEHSLTGSAFVSGHTHATHAFDFLYISWTDMTTLGNNVFTPANNMARILQMLTTAYGLLLFSVMLALGMNPSRRTRSKDLQK